MIRKTTLQNGVSVLTETMPGCASASVGLTLGVGSREETERNNGVAHLFEHAVFKGTAKRSPLEIAQAVELRGGILNAYTTREQTCFYARTAAADVLGALDVICEMVREPALAPDAVALEKSVVVEEIRSCLDDPEDLAGDLFCEALWGKAGPGLPITGTVSSVRGLGVGDLRAHRRTALERRPVVVAAAGGVDHAAVVRAAELALGNCRAAARRRPAPRKPVFGTVAKRSSVQQADLVYGTFLPLAKGAEFDRVSNALFAVHLLLGEGMSSRLFQRIREDLGLVYSISTNIDLCASGFVFSVQFGAEPGKAGRAMATLAEELAAARRDGFSDEEIERTREMMKGGLILAAESSSSRAASLTQRELLGLPPADLDARVRAVDAFTAEDVRALLARLLDGRRWSCGAVLPKGQRLDVRRGMAF